jgi:adenylate cyclase class IV
MQREIEKKYLLKDKAARCALVEQLYQIYPGTKLLGTKTVISYFYEPAESKDQILAVARKLLKDKELAELTKLVKHSVEIMVKCRSIDDTNYFSVKGAAAGQDAVHAANRMEFEAGLSMSLEEINQVIVDAGIKLVSKWSSRRDFYSLGQGLKADIEFVAGYGHKAELEVVIQDGESVDDAMATIDELADKLDLYYASDELMGRMYAYYNQHWEEFFNTDNVFSDRVWQELGRI